MHPQSFPYVSLGIPLYRSARFVESIKRNIEAIDYANVEVLISDRHCHDNALAQLEEYFWDDQRVSCFAATDELSWVENFNFLLAQGRGCYFRWMPHDDIFAKCNLTHMVEYLETHPDTVIVWGPTKMITENGKFIYYQNAPKPCANPPWTFDISLLFNFDDYCNGALKGLCRREIVDRYDLHIGVVHQLQYSERCWLFAMSLLGKMHFTQHYDYEKRCYPSSTHTQWQPSIPNIVGQWWMMNIYLWRLPNTQRNRILGTGVLTLLTLRKLAAVLRSRILRLKGHQPTLNLPESWRKYLTKTIRYVASSRP